MKAAMQYTSQEKKTLWNGHRLVSGYNCSAESAYADFIHTKKLYRKDSGRMFYHMVQSFPSGENVNPVVAHAAAMRLAEWYKDREVLVCTHVDREHIHSHFIINSVSFEDGKKLHIAKEQLEELRQANDRICMEFGLPVFEKQQRKRAKSMSTAEYHVAVRGESAKLRLMNNIDACMRRAATRDEFISLMEKRGYKVRWDCNRKYITYTAPSGWKCRDCKLFDDKYLKERMEIEFDIRREIINGGAAAAKQRAGASERGDGLAADGASVRRAGGERRGDTAADVRDAAGHRDDMQDSAAHRVDAQTGWEAEREVLFNPEVVQGDTDVVSAAVVDHSVRDSVVGSVVQLGYALDRASDGARVKDATTMPARSDRKALAQERRKKAALGQKASDHEDGRLEQTM